MIPIQNIYYMLSYAFQILTEQGYKNIATEKFGNTAELMAAILAKGISLQIKRGLGKEYIQKTEALSSLRGRIDIERSIKTQTMLKKQLICEYDDFSVNTTMNRIIRSTVDLLLRSDISKERKKELKKLMVYFGDVEPIDLHTVNWNIRYNRNNQTYHMLISVCWLVVKGLLQTNSDGSTRLMDFLDEQRICRLYEKFILEYYRREFPQITANASQIPWQLDDGIGMMLPVMQTDIMLTYKEKILIIDAKYWTISKDNNISSIRAYERNNPIKTSYELLWDELKSNTNASLITTQNIMRRILENYFSILGKSKDDTIVDSFSTIEEKIICRSLLSWINDGSHSIPDDLYIDSYTDSIDRYKEIFKEIFIKMGHEAHYKMMMREG